MLATVNNKTQVRGAAMLPIDSPGPCRSKSLMGIQAPTSAIKHFQRSTVLSFAINQSESASWFVEQDLSSRDIAGGENGHCG